MSTVGRINNGESGLSARTKLNLVIDRTTVFDTAANFTSNNPILNVGQLGVETDDLLTVPKFKIGDGANDWNTLPYFSSGGGFGVQSVTGPNVDNTDPTNPIVITPNFTEVIAEDTTANNLLALGVLDKSATFQAANLTLWFNLFNNSSGALFKSSLSSLQSLFKTNFDTIYTTASAVASQITTALSGYLTIIASNNFDKDKNNFRLTLTSGLSVTTSDVVNAQTIYCTPHNGNVISLYDGAKWVLYESNEFSLALGTLTAGNYDVFCYANAGVPTLEFTAWTGSTTPVATNKLAGITVKASDNTRRLVGSFTSMGNQSATVTISNATPAVVTYTGHGLKNNAPVVFTTTGVLPSGLVAGNTYYLADLGTSTANTFNVSATPGGAVIATTTAGSGTHTCTVGTYTEDSNANRCLENFDNPVLRMMQRAEQTASWTYNGALRQVNANLLNQVNFINRDSQYISAIATIRVACSNASGLMIFTVNLNDTSTYQGGGATYVPQATANDIEPIIVNYDKLVSTGYNYLSICEASTHATTTWYGNTLSYCQITGYKLG